MEKELFEDEREWISDDDAIYCMACGKPFYDGGGLYCSSFCEELGNPSGEGL